MVVSMQPLHQQNTIEARHPLVAVHRQTSIESVRVLSLGGSSTYGEGLDSYTQSYPYRLSKTTRNAAVRSRDLTMTAACTQSIVKEDVFDVITIEAGTNTATTEVLLKRVRLRFPHAKIVLIQIWHPSDVLYLNDTGKYVDLSTYRRQRGLKLGDKELYESILTDTDPARWSIATDENLAGVAALYQATFRAMPLPPADIFEYPQTMLRYMEIFEEDGDNLNALGHAKVFELLRPYLEEDPRSNPLRNEVGSWGSGDRCELWYQHGNLQINNLRHGSIAEFGHEGAHHKHALEIRQEGFRFTILNPFADDRMLYLTYMTSIDDLVDKIYPKTRIALNGAALVRLDPFHEDSQSHQLTRTSAVGHVSPGANVVELQPMEESPHPFRLVGISLIATELNPSFLEFGLEAEPAPEEIAPTFGKLW
jgi:hypothetical protein